MTLTASLQGLVRRAMPLLHPKDYGLLSEYKSQASSDHNFYLGVKQYLPLETYQRLSDLEPLARIAMNHSGGQYGYLSERLRSKRYLFELGFKAYKGVLDSAPASLNLPASLYLESLEWDEHIVFKRFPLHIKENPKVAQAFMLSRGKASLEDLPELLQGDLPFLRDLKDKLMSPGHTAVQDMFLLEQFIHGAEARHLQKTIKSQPVTKVKSL